jgi:hypothetical protein
MSSMIRDFSSQVQNNSERETCNLVQVECNSLRKLKRVSMRSGAWFRVLDWKQRRLLDIVVKTVDKIRSPLLLRVLFPLVKRLLEAIGGDVRTGALALMGEGAYEMMRRVAEKIVAVAQKWGNSSAREWLDDGLIKYLLVMNLPRNRNFATGKPW